MMSPACGAAGTTAAVTTTSTVQSNRLRKNGHSRDRDSSSSSDGYDAKVSISGTNSNQFISSVDTTINKAASG